MKGKKNLQSKYFKQQSSQSDLMENQMIYRQVKVNRIQHHKTSLTTNAKETSLDGEKVPTGNKKIMEWKISPEEANIQQI